MYHVSDNHTYEIREIRMCHFGPVPDQPYFLVPVICDHPTEQT